MSIKPALFLHIGDFRAGFPTSIDYEIRAELAHLGAKLRPFGGLLINGGLQLLNAKYSSFPAGICSTARPIGGGVLGGNVSAPCNLDGKRPPSAPELSYSLGATYTIYNKLGAFALTATDGYKASFYWESDNRLKQAAYHLINASVTWTAMDPRYSVQLFGRNLGDKYYFVSGAEGSNDAYLPGAPRTYGVMFRYQY